MIGAGISSGVLVAGITEHQALIASALVFVQALTFGHACEMSGDCGSTAIKMPQVSASETDVELV